VVHLVLFASEQTIPNLMAVELVRLAEPNQELSVYIYTTESSEKSRVPGEKLKWLIEKKRRAFRVEIGPESPSGSPGPAEIQAYLSQLMHDSKEQWYVCLNGGTRLMTYGFLGVTSEKKQTYFYRDLENGLWFELNKNGDGVAAVSRHDWNHEDKELLKGYTIAELIELQHPGRHKRLGKNYEFEVVVKNESSECGDEPDALKLEGAQLIQTLTLNNHASFDWKKFNDSGDSPVIFEDLMAQLIKAFYPLKFSAAPEWRIRTRVKLHRKDGSPLNEIDVVLFDGSALHLFEMKLKSLDSDETIPALVTRYAQLRRQLAGLAGTATIVAPTSIGQDAESQIGDDLLRASAKTFDVELWGISELIEIPALLTKQLGAPIEVQASKLDYFSSLRPHLEQIAVSSLVDLAWGLIRLKHCQTASISQPGFRQKFQFFPCDKTRKEELKGLLLDSNPGLTVQECSRSNPKTLSGLGAWSPEDMLANVKSKSESSYKQVLEIARAKLKFDKPSPRA